MEDIDFSILLWAGLAAGLATGAFVGAGITWLVMR